MPNSLAEYIGRACVRWRAKPDFNIACKPFGQRADALMVVIGNKTFLFDTVSTPFNGESIVSVAHSKTLFYQFMSYVSKEPDYPNNFRLSVSQGYFQPGLDLLDTEGCKSLPTLNAIAEDVESCCRYPVIVKPDKGSQSINVRRAYNRKELMLALNAVYSGKDYNPDVIAIVQENISIKHEFRALCFDGKCIFLYEKQPNETPDRTLHRIDWAQSKATLIYDQKLKMECERIAEFMCRYGLVYNGLDIAIDDHDRLFVIEANSKPGIAELEEDIGEAPIMDLTDRMMCWMAKDAGYSVALS